MLKKRGISPLIATVILVGFAVAIIILVLLWGSKYIRDIQEKEGEIAATRLSCSTDVAFAILDVEAAGNDLSIQIENLREPLDSFYVIIRGPGNDQDTIEVTDDVVLATGEIKILRVTYDPARVETAKEVDIVPRLAVAPGVYESCSGQHETYELEE